MGAKWADKTERAERIRAGVNLTTLSFHTYLAQRVAFYWDSVMRAHRGNIRSAAQSAGVSRSQLYRQLQACKLDPESYRVAYDDVQAWKSDMRKRLRDNKGFREISMQPRSRM